MIPGETGNPYDLQPLIDIRKPLTRKVKKDGEEGTERENDNVYEKNPNRVSVRPRNLRTDRYYTLSKKGFTTFVNDEPIEFIALHEWIKDRRYYQQLTNKDFFRNFRKWKIIRMWRRNILQNKRDDIKKTLEEKLF